MNNEIQRSYNIGCKALGILANQLCHPLYYLHQRPNFMSTYQGLTPCDCETSNFATKVRLQLYITVASTGKTVLLAAVIYNGTLKQKCNIGPVISSKFCGGY